MEIHEVIDHITEIWQLLTPAEQELFAKNMSVRIYRRKQVIYREGDPGTELLFLVSGKVRVSRMGVGNRRQLLQLMQGVQFFGYRSAFLSEPHVTQAEALDLCVVGCVPMPIVRKVMEQNIRLCHFIIDDLARLLGRLDQRTVNLTQKHLRGRLAEALLLLLDTYGFYPGTRVLSLSITRRDLGDLSNMTTANAIRTLSDFAKEGIVTISGRKITVIDEERLHAISENG